MVPTCKPSYICPFFSLLGCLPLLCIPTAVSVTESVDSNSTFELNLMLAQNTEKGNPVLIHSETKQSAQTIGEFLETIMVNKM